MSDFSAPLSIPFAFPGVAGVRCAFGTRVGGQSIDPFDQANVSFDVGDEEKRVVANRTFLQRSLGFVHWAEVRQVHGTAMVFDPDPGDVLARPRIEADGLATARPGQALAIKTADCQPILVAHRSGQYVCALHVGWRGNVLDFPRIGVEAFCRQYSLDPADCLAVRGPSLGPSAAVFEQYDSEFGAGFNAYYDAAARTVDLWALTRDQLLAAGLKPRHIYSLDLCTHSLTNQFYSYRRNQRTGRQASLIWIRRNTLAS